MTEKEEDSLWELALFFVLVMSFLTLWGLVLSKPWEQHTTLRITNEAGIPFQDFFERTNKIAAKRNQSMLCNSNGSGTAYCIISDWMSLDSAELVYLGGK